jgi:hypothetical protein
MMVFQLLLQSCVKDLRLVVWSMSFSGNRTGAREEEEWVGGRELVKKEAKCLFGV